MSTGMMWQTTSVSSEDTSRLGELLGSELSGGAVVELVADLGGGKTTFTQGLAKGMGSRDIVSSPTFTLSKVYRAAHDIEIHHFDLYRLGEAGVLADQLSESLHDKRVVTVIEWSDIVRGVLPEERLTIEFSVMADNQDVRQISISYPPSMQKLVKKVATAWQGARP